LCRDRRRTALRAALAASEAARLVSSPNPWVGCRIVTADGAHVYDGATAAPGDRMLRLQPGSSWPAARDSTVFVTLEPCPHFGRTPPCVDALLAAGVRRVVVGTLDPDPLVGGEGVRRLRAAGVEVTVGVCEDEVREALAPYLKQRTTGRPWVLLKLAATLDGRIAAPDGDSSWITGAEARADVHRLRAMSDAVLVGAGTVRSDDPHLTVRDSPGNSPLRVVLGAIPPHAAVLPRSRSTATSRWCSTSSGDEVFCSYSSRVDPGLRTSSTPPD